MALAMATWELGIAQGQRGAEPRVRGLPARMLALASGSSRVGGGLAGGSEPLIARSVPQVQWVGHEDRTTTMIYAHVLARGSVGVRSPAVRPSGGAGADDEWTWADPHDARGG